MIRHRKQQGISTIVVAILLLAILTVVTAFALNVGVFEQRTVGNEMRARIVAQVADAGLNHAIEVVKANSALLTAPDSDGGWGGRWVQCNAADTTFPCGAEPDSARRATLYRYSDAAAGGNALNFIGVGSRIAPASAVAASVGAFPVTYRVGALLCLIDQDDGSTCVPYEDNYRGLMAVTVVSRASLADDPLALADVKATIASYRRVGNGPNVPIIASGNVDLGGGTADIVPNPNAGGPGVALSVWSGETVCIGGSGPAGCATGAIKSCHLGEFLANAQGNRGPTQFDGIVRCDDCRCDGLSPEKGLISGKYTTGGSGAGRDKNYDILDASTDGVLPPNTYFPDSSLNPRMDDEENCLDDTLFEYLFGVDVVQTPGCPAVEPNADIAFLQENAQVANCATMGPASGGLYWHKASAGACTLPNTDIGTPSDPVFLVVDGDVTLRGTFFGVLFVRANNAEVHFQGQSVLYGSVVVEGSVRLRGNPKFVYNEKVINAVLQGSRATRFGLVPGSWTDVVGVGD
ncbi:MAG: PilX N-terminal domain-containing pilus assembly protein [Fimbriimonadaceae bacterium]|jgi:hypothetical protein